MDIYRNGMIYNSRRNNYTFTDNFRIVGSGTMTYKICNQGTTECSNDVTVNYTSAKTAGASVRTAATAMSSRR